MQGKNHESLAHPLYAQDLNESFCVIDMRYPEDYAKIHIKDSHNLNNPYDIYEFIRHRPHQKYVLVCYSGHLASILGNELVEEGLENIYFYDDEFSTLQNANIQLITK